MRYHAERSVLQTHPEEIVKRFSAFYKSLDAHQGIIPASEIGRFRSSCESYIALHLALTGNHKKAALHHLKNAFSCDAGIVFSRRFYAILKHLI
jgi:archaellum biogenesis ATPase FlaH